MMIRLRGTTASRRPLSLAGRRLSGEACTQTFTRWLHCCRVVPASIFGTPSLGVFHCVKEPCRLGRVGNSVVAIRNAVVSSCTTSLAWPHGGIRLRSG